MNKCIEYIVYIRNKSCMIISADKYYLSLFRKLLYAYPYHDKVPSQKPKASRFNRPRTIVIRISDFTIAYDWPL